MRAILLAASAALAALAADAPAEAQSSTAGAFVGVPAVNVHRGSGHFGDFRRDFDRRRDRRGFDNGVVYHDREYQGDTAWKADSFNDWWHERPWRSMPRWVQGNENCQRLWWSGGNWRC
jgi:hypothetical protein